MSRAVLVFAVFGFVSLAAAQQPPAIEELRARVGAQPESGADWYALGRALQDAQQYADALAAFERARELKFQPAGAAMRSAQILALSGDTEGAMRLLEQAAAVAPVALSLLPQIGGIPQLEGDPRLQKLLADAEAARYPCTTRPESRQLDFWLGEWAVSNPQGQVVGNNVITVDLQGCVVRESWTDAFGSRGTSVNFYDPATKLWHQVWTSENGTVTHYEGSWSAGAMRFFAKGFGDADGVTQHRRMTFTPNPDGSVRQLIEESTDGATWTVGFDGLYRKQATAG
jgi:tetratricopeptide (TPR) repeat protein